MSEMSIENFGSINSINDDKMENNPTYLLINKNEQKNQNIPLYSSYGTNRVRDDSKQNINDRMIYPDADNLVKYDNDACFTDVNKSGIRKVDVRMNRPEQSRCSKNLGIGRVNNIKTGIMTADGRTVDQSINYYVPMRYLGQDPHIKGYNYSTIMHEPQADIDQIGSIPVNNYDGQPMAVDSLLTDSNVPKNDY
jgi:hypothetical protein